MPIRPLFSGQDESIEGFEAAADSMYEAGFNLMASAQSGQGVYLMGYVAEMLLKSAYFRLRRFADSQVITMTDLRDAVQRHHLALPSEKYHDLELWARLITGERAASSLSNPGLEADLQSKTTRLNTNWSVKMRYYPLQGIARQDLEDVLDDVVWIKSSHNDFWR